MAHRVPPVSQGRSQQPTVSSSPDTARLKKCPRVLRGLSPSMRGTLCYTCRAMRGHTGRTSVGRALSFVKLFHFTWKTKRCRLISRICLLHQAQPAAAWAGSAPCPSCSATSTTSAASHRATTTPTGCPRQSPCRCPWKLWPGRASSLTSAGGQGGRWEGRSSGSSGTMVKVLICVCF